ncbi:MAG TPA: hypothetical protein VGY53_10535 [Isosphaeraceae bacterium]|nr:hypothetical protein [Isosphaeraceae bacterium]
MSAASQAWLRPTLIGLAITCALGAALAAEAIWTQPVRASVQTYFALIDAANHEDVGRARALCTARFRALHSLEPAPEGGLVGLPRGIDKNFQVWRKGPYVWLCPANRVGPVFQFVHEGGQWRFDGPVGLLLPGGEVERLEAAEGDHHQESRAEK